MLESFWMVWNPAANPPTHRHSSLESARAESERLARANPGQEFYVLMSVGRSRRVDVAWEEMDPIPF